jgi:hypothetical protein
MARRHLYYYYGKTNVATCASLYWLPSFGSLNLALDIRDMRATEDLNAKFVIYKEGKNALPLSLASLSLFAKESYGKDPLFVLYKYNFQFLGKSQEEDADGLFDGFPAEEYANTVVTDVFALESDHVAAEAALVLNVMMAIWGSLYDALRACDRNDADTNDDMYGALDIAAALWVGTDQVKSGNEEGYMLYNLTEYAGSLFGQGQGESLLNTLVLESFDFLRQDVNNNRCAAGVDAYVVVRAKVKILIRFTNVVMVQILLHYVENAVTAGSDFVKLYTLAILPQISNCDSGIFDTLFKLAVAQDVTTETKDDIILAIQASLSCLGITCDDVGVYKGGGLLPECDDSVEAGIPYLAEYLPLTDVRRKSHIDRDIRAIEIFMVEDAYEAAKEYYLYGWNTFFNLSQLAQNAFSPGPTPDFDLFNTYYEGTDYDFAHNIIMDVLEKQPPYDNASTKQRSATVVGILRSVVMYLSTLAELDSAVDECDKSGGSTSTLELWDGGAAFFIGSSEGQLPSGQSGGQLLFGLAKELCGSFGTCEPQPKLNAEINKVVVQALLVGSENLEAGKCDVVRIVLENSIKPVLRVPLVQGTLYYAAQSVNLPAGTASGDLGSLYAFSRAVLPAISNVYVEGASLVESNSEFQLITNPVPDGLESMFGVFRVALQATETDCSDIGVLTTDNVENSVCATDSPSEFPSLEPSTTPTLLPTHFPTASPTDPPTNTPSEVPSRKPSATPTEVPTRRPTLSPTATPSELPSRKPSTSPTEAPTSRPTRAPTVTPTTEIPSEIPTNRPSNRPTKVPTQSPTVAPTQSLSKFPSNLPSSSQSPSTFPTTLPSTGPSWIPSDVPTFIPSLSPTLTPSALPSGNPSSIPTVSLQPTTLPSTFPTGIPTVSLQPTTLPSIFPTIVPSIFPTSVPTSVPSTSTQSPATSAPSRNPNVVDRLSEASSNSPTTTATTTTPTASPAVGSTSGGAHYGSRATTTLTLLWSTFLATAICVGW